MAPQVIDATAPRHPPAQVAADPLGLAAAASAEQALQRASELGESGRHAAALAVLERALQDHGASADLHAACGWALENASPPRWADARAAYEQALALTPGHPWAGIGLATTLARLGHGAACAPLYATAAEQASARAADEPELLEALGWCQYRLGRLDAAADTFERALGLDPAWISVRFDLGLVGLLRGDGHAASHYEAAIDALAQRSAECRIGPLRIAFDDLEEALDGAATDAAPRLAARACGIRERLVQALQVATTP